MSLEEFRAKAISKPKQVELSFEKKKIKWEGRAGDGIRDRFGEEGELYLAYDGGKCTINGQEVPFRELLSAIGPNQMFHKNDQMFQEMLKAEERKNLKKQDGQKASD